MITTQLSHKQQPSRQLATTSAITIVAVAYFIVAIVVLHLLRPDLSPLRYPTSQYAVGPYGWLMTSAFFSISVASWALLLGLARGVPRPAQSRAGMALMGLWAVGVLIAMIFPLEPVGAPPTISSTIHRSNGPLAFLSVTTGVALVSGRFKHDETWRSLYRSAMSLSMLLLAGFIATSVGISTESGYGGLAQRIVLALLVAWMLLIAAHLRSMVRKGFRV